MDTTQGREAHRPDCFRSPYLHHGPAERLRVRRASSTIEAQSQRVSFQVQAPLPLPGEANRPSERLVPRDACNRGALPHGELSQSQDRRTGPL